MNEPEAYKFQLLSALKTHPTSIAFFPVLAHSVLKCFSSAPLCQPLRLSHAYSVPGRWASLEAQGGVSSALPLSLA